MTIYACKSGVQIPRDMTPLHMPVQVGDGCPIDLPIVLETGFLYLGGMVPTKDKSTEILTTCLL